MIENPGTNQGAREYLKVLPSELGPWNVAANITTDPRGGANAADLEMYGTPVFAPGAKVYVGDLTWGTGGTCGVVGQNRVSKKLSVCLVSIQLLENLRAKVVYNTAVLLSY